MATNDQKANVATMEDDLYGNQSSMDIEIPFDAGDDVSSAKADTQTDPTDGQHLVTCKAVYASADEKKTSISVLFVEEESGKSAQINFNTMKWDDNAPNARGGKGAFINDAETEAETKAKIQELFGVSFDEIVASGMAVSGKTFKCYFNGERGSLYPIKKFIKFEKNNGLPVKTQNILKRDYSMKDIELLPVDEWKGRYFIFGFQAEIDGEMKNFRISQFCAPSDDIAKPDKVVGVKYDGGKEVGKQRDMINDMINNSHLPEDSEPVRIARERLDAIVSSQRPDTVNALKEIGIDVEKLLETGERITIHGFELVSFGNDNGTYIKAFV